MKKNFPILCVLTLTLPCQGCAGSMFYQPDKTVYAPPTTSVFRHISTMAERLTGKHNEFQKTD